MRRTRWPAGQWDDERMRRWNDVHPINETGLRAIFLAAINLPRLLRRGRSQGYPHVIQRMVDAHWEKMD